MSEDSTKTAIEAGKLIASADIVEIAGVPMLRVPGNYEVREYPEYMERPRRIRFSMEAHTVEGFCDYITRYGDEPVALFHSIEHPFFKAIFDFHEQGKPNWCDHNATLAMTKSQQFSDWCELAARPVDQMAFAEFIEQHADDVNAPPVTELLEAVLNFRQTTNINFSSVRRLDNGQTELVYQETDVGHQDAGRQATRLPSEITLAIPVFEGGTVYAIRALLRYRAREGGIKLWFEIAQLPKVRRQAVQDVIDQVRRNLPDVPMYAGDPIERPMRTQTSRTSQCTPAIPSSGRCARVDGKDRPQ